MFTRKHYRAIADIIGVYSNVKAGIGTSCRYSNKHACRGVANDLAELYGRVELFTN